MSNPLSEIRFEIPFDAIEASHIIPAAHDLIKETQAAIDAIIAESGPRTYANTLNAIELATERLEFGMGVVDHLESVATTDAWREAYNEARPLVSAFWSALSMNAKLYEAVLAYAESEGAQELPAVKKRFLEKTLDSFRRHGAALDDEKKAKLAEFDVELAKVTTKFSQNVLDATNAFELVIFDEDKLSGLPESAKAAAAQAAKEKDSEGWRFTLQAPSLIPLLTYLDDRSTRQKVWHAHNTRATQGEQDNRPLIIEILRLRKEKALLLNYPDFADLVLEDRMAKSGDEAWHFIDDLRGRTLEAFHKENQELQRFVSELGDSAPEELQPWDLAYYAEKLRKARYDFDEEELRPYFPAPRVLEGLFELVQRLYGIRIIEQALPTWHPSVKTYAIETDAGEHIASFYADLFPRESKRDGAWMNALITGVAQDGQQKPHLGLFCANINPAIGDTPALLTHREVETLFHEFGHLLHHCFSRVPVRSLAGTNVAWDFVELPSQIMENWCWEREALDLFARHYESDAPIPEELFAKMTSARTFRAANAQMRQIAFATVDLALHTRYNLERDGDVMEYARRILQEHSSVTLPDDYAMITGFGHLFADPTGYAAAYYSYKWAEVLDADAFTRFKREGIFNQDTGRAFREEILEKGDSEDPNELYRNFMGREPSVDALLERSGLL